jgi:YD repeat-containing protein
MIYNLEGNAFTDLPYFDVNFIRVNKIKSVSGNYSIKKDGDMIRNTKDIFEYKFDSLGYLISTFETKTVDSKTDTLMNFYQYTSAGKISMHRKSEYGGISSFHYTYDSLNRLVYVENRRDVLGDSGKVRQSFLINNESMRYFPLENGWKKVIYNNYNLPYLEETEKRNSDGYLIETTQRMRMASSEYKKVYAYNEKGLLSRVSMYHSELVAPYEEWVFKYDSFGNVIEKHTYKNEKFTKDLQIIYDTKTQLLGSTIQKEANSNFMLILRFQGYKFY